MLPFEEKDWVEHTSFKIFARFFLSKVNISQMNGVASLSIKSLGQSVSHNTEPGTKTDGQLTSRGFVENYTDYRELEELNFGRVLKKLNDYFSS